MFQTPTTAPNLLLHIPSMDCMVKEAEIRRALKPVTGIALLDFQLGARKLNISGSPQALTDSIDAIRAAGFKSEPLFIPILKSANTADHSSTDGPPADSGLHDDHNMWMAVFADMGGSLPVMANGLRLLRFRG